MGRWLLPFTSRSPDDPENTRWEVGIREAKFRRIQRSGHQSKLARIMLVDEVLKSPTLLIEGWHRPDREDCLVYVGKPQLDYQSATIECPPPPNMLFLVFVLPDGTIDDWAWRPVSDDNPSWPDGLNGKVLWQLT